MKTDISDNQGCVIGPKLEKAQNFNVNYKGKCLDEIPELIDEFQEIQSTFKSQRVIANNQSYGSTTKLPSQQRLSPHRFTEKIQKSNILQGFTNSKIV